MRQRISKPINYNRKYGRNKNRKVRKYKGDVKHFKMMGARTTRRHSNYRNSHYKYKNFIK